MRSPLSAIDELRERARLSPILAVLQALARDHRQSAQATQIARRVGYFWSAVLRAMQQAQW